MRNTNENCDRVYIYIENKVVLVQKQNRSEYNLSLTCREVKQVKTQVLIKRLRFSDRQIGRSQDNTYLRLRKTKQIIALLKLETDSCIVVLLSNKSEFSSQRN